MPKLTLTYTLADVKALIIADAAKAGHIFLPEDICANFFVTVMGAEDVELAPKDYTDIFTVGIK